jgi:pimeloyl-ACP methyl ester carboxylesterase
MASAPWHQDSPSIRRSRWRWLRRGLVGALALLVVLSGSGFVYETIAQNRDRKNFPPPGEMVDVGDFRLHLNVMGEPTDGPTVVLEHGGGAMTAQWGWIQSEIADFTQVVAYDRPNLGWSDDSPEQLTAAEEAALLRSALEQLGISGPYVFVGHSMGALLARSYAALYPDEVVGMVLVDPRPLSWEPVHGEGSDEINDLQFQIIGVAARLGIIRLSGMVEEVASPLPERQANEGVAMMSTQRHFSGSVKDGKLGESAIDVIRAEEDVTDMPLIVVSGGTPDDSFDAGARERFNRTHEELAALSTRGEHRVVEAADHFTLMTDQGHAQATVHAIEDLYILATESNQ